MSQLLQFRVREELADEIKALAAADRRPVAQYVARLVEDEIAKRSTPRPKSAA